MRKVGLLGAAVALLATGLVGGSLLPASSQGAQTETFTVCDKTRTGFQKSIDVGKKNFSAGDYIVEANPYVNPQTGNRAGRDAGTLTVIRRRGRDALFAAHFTSVFPRGKIIVDGIGKFSNLRKGLNFAITGGTARYDTASGTVTAQLGRCDGARALRLRFQITL